VKQVKFKTQEEKKIATVIFDILKGLLSPVVVCNNNGVIVFANKMYRELASVRPENKLFWDVYPYRKLVPEYFKIAVDERKETRSKVNIKNMSFIVRVIPVDKILADELLYVIYFEDITSEEHLKEQLEVDNQLLQKSFLDTILALSDFIESRDPYTDGHQKRVASLSLNIASRANITNPKCLSAIYYGALMHDIGKIAIPMDYLVTPRRLCEFQEGIMKSHVIVGHKIIEHIDFPWDIKSVVYQHHERMDGSGYPHGLKGDEITIPARIVAIADVYESMSTNRPYRNFVPHESVINYLEENKGILFDANYIDSLFQCLEEVEDVYIVSSDFIHFDPFKTRLIDRT